MKRLLPRSCLMVVFISLFCSVGVEGQIITTIAGNGIAGYSGDNGPATAAKLFQPSYLCIDASGNILIADFLNNVIRKVNPTGLITTIAGNGVGGYLGDGGPATNAEIRGSMGIAVDGIGNIYFSESNNHIIRKINTLGIISTVAGIGISGYSGDGMPATASKLNTPYGVTVDNSGNIYFADNYNYRVRKINSYGIISTIAGNGTIGFSGDNGPATAAQFKYFGGISISATGEIYIADYANHRIRKVSNLGTITTFAGNGILGNSGDNGPATAAELNGPNGVYVDKSTGNVYITDNYANVIRKVNTMGIISTIAGNGTSGYSGDNGSAIDAQLDNPNDIAMDASGNIFIADDYNNVIRKITYNHTVVSTIKNTQNNVTIYPNPAHNEITISASDKIESVEVVSPDEKLAMTLVASPRPSPKEREMLCDISGLPAGVYFVKVNGVWAGRFVKE